MKIGLHDSEKEHFRRRKNKFPNYALMKISAYHKSKGDRVEWWNPDERYDLVYSSKIFDFTPENPLLPPNTIKGGTGYDIKSVLPPEIENMFPDYSIYPECDYAIGYITRGRPNKCRWCYVPEKEGDIKPYRDWKQLVRPDSKKLVLMDNNILACEYGISQLESMIDSGYYIDLNQGMDARLVTDRVAQILSGLKWISYIRFSCDTIGQIEAIENTVNLLLSYGVKTYKIFIYLLVTKDIENAAYRVERLKRLGCITIYAQAERNERKGIIPNKLQLEFTNRYIYSGKYRTETWNEYCQKRKIGSDEMQTYICKCGKIFEKSCTSETTGYTLDGYSPKHECYGCPYIITERDWKTKKPVKYECRATPRITYRSCCKINTEDFSSCYLYTLDLVFAGTIIGFMSNLNGCEENKIPDEWRAADFGRCWAFENCFGLAIIPLKFSDNQKGKEARKTVKEMFFDTDGYRKRKTAEEEEKIIKDNIAAQILCAKKKAEKELAEKFGDDNMKIDLSGFSQPMTEPETAPEKLDSPLEQSYSDTFGKTYNKVQELNISLLSHYKDENNAEQPYHIDDEKVEQITLSAADIGIITPLIVREINNGYQIIAGHHRFEAAKRLNKLSVPCVIRNISDEEVFQFVAESNIQRNKTLPSEYGKIFSIYKSKRKEIDMGLDDVAAKFGVSTTTMYRYISISKLIPELRRYFDEEKVCVSAADTISGFTEENQDTLVEYLDREGSKKITPAIAKKFAEIVENYHGDKVPVDELSALFLPLPKPKYKHSVYNNLSSRFKIEQSEDELNELAEKLLTEYFEKLSKKIPTVGISE